jgi:hypothetical protein
MDASFLQGSEFWRVNGYGYPNPFIVDGTNAQAAWRTFCSFFEHDKGLYSDLKKDWESGNAPRGIKVSTVESWKAAFEEYGLLYVISRSNTISVTPAGRQFYAAAKQDNRQQFAWIGLNLLFRRPLRGTPRDRSRTAAHRDSDLLLYRFLYAAMRDLGDYFWWSELERILCRVFSTSQAQAAVRAVKDLRADPSKLTTYLLPVQNREGAFYNSLNQVAVHAGMNHFVLQKDNRSEYYGPDESKRRHLIKREYLSVVSAALGDSTLPTECGASASYVDRLPTAPSFLDEQSYFDYLGASVPDLVSAGDENAPRRITDGDGTVFILGPAQFDRASIAATEPCVEGKMATFCRIARGHRVILSIDLQWTYRVVGKEQVDQYTVRLLLRRSRPIVKQEPIQILLGGDDVRPQ